MKKYDKIIIGLIPGILLPVLVFIITWTFADDVSLGAYIEQFRKIHKIASLISLSTLPNLLLFFLFIWTNKYRSANGVIFATFLLAFVMLIAKFI